MRDAIGPASVFGFFTIVNIMVGVFSESLTEERGRGRVSWVRAALFVIVIIGVGTLLAVTRQRGRQWGGP